MVSVAVPSVDAVRHENGTVPGMKKSDLACPECNAGYRRIELISKKGVKGEFVFGL